MSIQYSSDDPYGQRNNRRRSQQPNPFVDQPGAGAPPTTETGQIPLYQPPQAVTRDPSRDVPQQQQTQPASAPAGAFDRERFRNELFAQVKTPQDLAGFVGGHQGDFGAGVEILPGGKGDRIRLPSGEVIDAVLAAGEGGRGPAWTGVGPTAGPGGGGGPALASSALGRALGSGGAAGPGFAGLSGELGGLQSDLLKRILTSPESLGPQVVGQLKERNKEEALAMQQQALDRFRQDQTGRGLRGSGAQERDIMEDAMSRILQGNRGVDIAAAQTNAADRINALQASMSPAELALRQALGMGSLDIQRGGLDLEGRRLSEQARQFNDQLGFNYGVFNYNQQMDPWRMLFGGGGF